MPVVIKHKTTKDKTVIVETDGRTNTEALKKAMRILREAPAGWKTELRVAE